MNYKDVIGHERGIRILQKSIENDSISHSYLFEGEEGIGKLMVAKIFAKTLLCKEKGSLPCDTCISCRKIDGENHPDLFIIEPKNKLIRKNEIEDLIKETTTSPFESDRKIFIIDDADTMNMESKNALLKTLEEPPEYINIILVSSNPNSLLDTILSRVESIKFYTVESDKIKNYLMEEYGLSVSDADFISSFSKGAVGKAIRLAEDEKFLENRSEIINIINELLKGDLTRVFGTEDFFSENKNNIEDLLDLMIYWFRDLLIYKELGESDLLVNKDRLNLLMLQSDMKSEKINDIILNIEETKENIRRNINYQLAIEVMLLNIGGK